MVNQNKNKMIFYLVFLFIVAFIFFCFKKKSISFLIIYISLSFLIVGIIFMIVWYSSKDVREQNMLEMEIIDNNYKKIIIKNKTSQRLYTEINFEYSKREIEMYKLNVLDYYNGKVVCIIDSQKESHIRLPIEKKYSIKFPNNFSVIVKDSLSNTIETYDERLFLEKSITQPKNINPKIKASSWVLEIVKKS